MSKQRGRRHPSPPRTVLRLQGELDLSDVPDVTAQLARAAADEHGDVVLDLSEVTFMDCAVLTVLVAARSRLGARLWLHEPAACVRRLLRLSGTAGVFAVLPAPPTVPQDPAGGQVQPARHGATRADADPPPDPERRAASGGWRALGSARGIGEGDAMTRSTTAPARP